MATQSIHIEINLNALLGVLQHALQYSSNLVSIALKFDIPRNFDDLRTTTTGLPFVTFDKQMRWSYEEAGQYFQTWVLSNGLRDAMESVSSFLESAHQILSIWDMMEHQNKKYIQPSEYEKVMDGKSFHLLGFPHKLTHLKENHGLSLDADLCRHAKSVNNARNCLVHRRGIVNKLDVDKNSQDTLTVEWRTFRVFFQDEDGEHEICIGQNIPNELVGKKIQFGGKVFDDKKIFHLGEQIKFTSQEFADITWSLFLFGQSIVQKINESGQGNIFLTPTSSIPQTNGDTID